MSGKNCVKVEWTDGADGKWRVTEGKLEESVDVTPSELKAMFPLFVTACREFCEMESSHVDLEDLDDIIGCAANSLAEIVPARKRFAVYRAVVFLLGYMDRTPLPPVLEDAIKATWAEPGEKFTGYIES